MPVILTKVYFDRWIVLSADDATLAWSGAEWVPVVGGDVAISNFDSWEEAAAYAESFQFVVAGRID